jgi:uncharacterized protein (DUF1015 family)
LAQVRPFAGIRYAHNRGFDFAKLIAPPYDVLDEKGKAALLAKDPQNIVGVDWPYPKQKEAGPDAVYAAAAVALQAWMKTGVLEHDKRPAFYPYSQSFEHHGRTFHRKGFIAQVKLTPFGDVEGRPSTDVIPHEKTYRGAIEDRMKLMRATHMQLSPIFGLYSDGKHEVNNALYAGSSRPEISAVLDGVKHDLWSVTDSSTETFVIDFMKRRPVYIADGHHRYTTALQYKYELEQASGGPLPPNHPANWCMFVLVGMQDDGLLILPTHRIIGGLDWFDPEAFIAALGESASVTQTAIGGEPSAMLEHMVSTMPAHTFGLYDGRRKTIYSIHMRNADVLAKFEPDKSPAWRQLDVAILQHYLLDQVIQPQFAAGKELTKAYTADATQVPMMTDGEKFQIALLLRPTPLHALEELGKTGEVMPQKSTFFAPKLATGMVINPLE